MQHRQVTNVFISIVFIFMCFALASCASPDMNVESCVAEEERCNGIDDDCDGAIDVDGFGSPLRGPCQNECGTGEQECIDGRWTLCSAPQPTVETCNGVDDDCNGEIDETCGCIHAETRRCSTGQWPNCEDGMEVCENGQWSHCTSESSSTTRPEICGGGGECPEEMVKIVEHGAVCIDRYEASRGSNGEALSVAGVYPWVSIDWDGASEACERAGKRLCALDEWISACAGLDDLEFGYGDAYQENTCNEYDYELWDPLPTGSMESCEAGYSGLFDMIGNVAEWTATCNDDGTCHQNMTSFLRPGEWANCSDEFYLPRTDADEYTGFRCCLTL